jgi:hypothetical protein
MLQSLERFDFSEAASLHRWIDAHEERIESAMFEWIAARKSDLSSEN